MTENPGGVESFLFNYYRKIDKTKIQFDFLVHSEEEGYFDKEILIIKICFLTFPWERVCIWIRNVWNNRVISVVNNPIPANRHALTCV